MGRKIEFMVDAKAVGYDRGAARHGRTPPDVAVWRQAVVTEYRLAAGPATMGLVYPGPVAVTVAAAGTNADADNVGKEVLDALTGVAYTDDSQVVRLLVEIVGRALTPSGKPKGLKSQAGSTRVVVEFLGLGQ